MKTEVVIPESQAVQMIIQNLRDPLRALMLLGPVRTYVELYERASQLERNLKKGMLGSMFSPSVLLLALSANFHYVAGLASYYSLLGVVIYFSLYCASSNSALNEAFSSLSLFGSLP